MRRHDLLVAASLAAGGLGGWFDFGCLDSSGVESATDLGTCPEREREGLTRPGRDLEESLQLSLRNDSGERRRVSVSLGVGRTYADERIDVSPGARHGIFKSDDGPSITGKYRITVRIENGGRLGVDWEVCKNTDDLVVVMSSGEGLGSKRPA